jgi:hypothetical protein
MNSETKIGQNPNVTTKRQSACCTTVRQYAGCVHLIQLLHWFSERQLLLLIPDISIAFYKQDSWLAHWIQRAWASIQQTHNVFRIEYYDRVWMRSFCRFFAPGKIVMPCCCVCYWVIKMGSQIGRNCECRLGRERGGTGASFELGQPENLLAHKY